MLRRTDNLSAKQHAEASVYLYKWEIDNPGLLGAAYNNLGIANKNLGLWGQAEDGFGEALNAYGRTREPVKSLATSQNLGVLLRKMGKIGQAEALCREGLHLSDVMALPLLKCHFALELGNISVIKRDATECTRHLAIARGIAEAEGYHRDRVLALEIEGDMQAIEGDTACAHQSYGMGLDLIEQHGLGADLEYELLRRRAAAYMEEGKTAEARQALVPAMDLASRSGDKYEEGACLRVLGEIEIAEGVGGIGVGHLRQSVDELTRLSLWNHELAISESALGMALSECADSVRACALEHLYVARRIYSNLGVSEAIRQLDRLISLVRQDSSRRPSPAGKVEKGRPGGRPVGAETGDGILPGPARYGIVTCDERVVGDLGRWGESDVRVLIEGETGVGKELVARAMHSMSRRREERFVAVDCGALSETLAESELFGHARGSFTGADRDRVGLIEEANGGTLLLDEVGELSQATQSKLLRVLEDGAVRRVGENRSRPVDVRVLSATTKDLAAEVEAGRFRRDLYHRLKGVVVRVPSLRERRSDVELLLDHFLETYNEQSGKGVTLGAEARELLLDYDWPGNVRELKHVVEAVVVSAGDGVVAGAGDVAEFLEARGCGAEGTSDPNEVEDRGVRQALEACGGNKAGAARRLGISRKTLYRRMKELQIE